MFTDHGRGVLTMKLKEWEKVEHSFFEIDEEKRIAKIVLKYETPEDILDGTCISDTPLLSLEALEYIRNLFGMVPSKYKMDLTLHFDNFSDYTEEELDNILKKNLALELKSKVYADRKRDKLAYCFIIAGVLSFLLMFLIKKVWVSESVWSELCFYLFDIITTVSLYQAVTILGLEKKESLAVIKNMYDSFSAIHFESKTKESPIKLSRKNGTLYEKQDTDRM